MYAQQPYSYTGLDVNAGKCSMKSVSLTILPWVPIQLAKKPLEKLLEIILEKPLEIGIKSDVG